MSYPNKIVKHATASYHVHMLNLDEIKQLSVAERIQLVEDIWDSIAQSPEPIPLTDTQKSELDRRLEIHKLDPQGSPWHEVRDRLLSKS